MSTRSLTNNHKHPPALGILDDYLNISGPHFAHIPSSKLTVNTFSDTIAPSSPSETARLAARLQPYTLISTIRERTPFPAELLRQLPNLRLLLATGTQFETFDLAAAKELGITVVAAPGLGRTDIAAAGARTGTNIKKGGSHPTTQHTWALILSLARNIAADDAALKTSSRWQTGPAIGLTGKTLGVVGLGRLGAAVARIGHLAFGMRIVCWSENLTQEKADQMAREAGLSPDQDGEKLFQAVGKEELLRSADVISMHYVLSDRSRGIIAAKELDLMKASALLVNTSRGPLIDKVALEEALEKCKIRGAAMDVFDVEPLPLDSPWRRANYWGEHGRSQLIVTPHMGYVNQELMDAWYAETAENVEKWLDGKPVLHRLV
jgi:phosphoglycerate dehydrogenase-like enzyme